MFKNLTPREKQIFKQSQVGVVISCVLLLVPIPIAIIFRNNDVLAKWLGIFGMLMVLSLLYFAWQILKIAYKEQKDDPAPPFWVPKVYGFGISINPYHRFGKILYVLLAIFIVIIIVHMFLTPASQVNY